MSPSTKRLAPKIKFLLDENVDVRLGDFLKKLGFDVSICPKGLKNGAIVALAHKETRVLLSNDKDFTNTALFPPDKYVGIVVFRIHPPSLGKLISSLEHFLLTIHPEEFTGKTFIIENEGIEQATEDSKGE